MPQLQDSTMVNLPDDLRGQFEKVERRLWRVETAAAVFGMVGSLVFSLLAVFISDRLWETPVWLRALLFLGGLGGATAAALQWGRHWVWQRRDLRALATLVQQKYRRLGDRLLGIVELSGEREHQPNFSPALYQAAIQQVAEQARQHDFLQSVNSRDATRFGWTAGGLSLAALAAVVVLPHASWNAFLRWAEPAASIERYTLVVLQGFRPEMVVAHGESFQVAGTVAYRSFWKPSHVTGRLGPLLKTDATAQAGAIHLQIPGQVENGVLEVRVGDAVARVKILPNNRPSLEQLSALIHLPDYLQYPDQSVAVQNGSLRAVEGSRISFRGKVSRPLVSALMQDGIAAPSPLTVQGPDFTSGTAEPPRAGGFTFSWRDQLGLTNAAPWRLSLQQQPDAPPVPDLPDMPRATAMLDSDVMHIRTTAEDDFGVRALGLNWDVVSDTPQTDIMTTETKVQTASPQEKKTEKTFLWSPSMNRIPPDSTVELQAFAQDYYPKRPRVRTASYFVRVLSPSEHADMVRTQLEALMAQIEEITRQQEKIVADTHDVKDAGKDMTPAQQADRLNQSQADQLQNAEHLQDLTHQGEDAVREAMKNPLIPEDTVRQWTKMLQQWQQLSEAKMQEAAKAMEAAAQNARSQRQEQNAQSREQNSASNQSQANAQSRDQNSQSKPQDSQSKDSQANSQSRQQNSQSQQSQANSQQRQQNSESPQHSAQTQPQAQQQDAQSNQEEVAEAVKRAEDILEALRELEQSANQHLDQLQAFTLAERLRKVGAEESGLGGKLTTNLADTIGLRPQELPDKFKLLNTVFVKEQGSAHDESAALESEISRFFERTQRTNYGVVSKDMKDSHTADELDRMGLLIQSNITVQTSLDLTNWSGRFEKWADILQPKQDSGQGGSQQQQSSSSQSAQEVDLTEVLMALLRMREREMNLRDETSVLEDSKQNAPDYKEKAGTLAGQQRLLSDVLDRLHKAAPLPQLNLPFNETASAMSDVQKLLDVPQTDSVTDTGEVKVVDELTDLINLINEQAQKQQQQQQQSAQARQRGSTAEEMGFLMRLMQQNSAQARASSMPQTGTLNTPGGVTDAQGHPVSGNVSGKNSAARNVNKAAGAIESYPVEFRAALENYFHAVEQPKP